MKPPMIMADMAAKVVRQLDPERAHRATVRMLSAGLGPRTSHAVSHHPMLACEVAGLKFSNPLGLAAGFDKNAQAMQGALDLGFGFIEVGGVTPRAQPGNDRPRVFRLEAERAVINRYGFNNDGLEAMAARLRGRPTGGVIGVNLGANKDSEDRIADYEAGLKGLDGLADFFTINVSSPNTPGLRALQDPDALRALLTRVLTARETSPAPAPVFLKIAPDLTDADKSDIAEIVKSARLDGLIVSNTTIARPDFLTSPARGETGGLSGAPLFAPSTELLGEFFQALEGAAPLIGVGGVSSPREAYEKIRAGADLVQLYTAMIYEGPGLIERILRELPLLARADGFEAITEAVGAAHH